MINESATGTRALGLLLLASTIAGCVGTGAKRTASADSAQLYAKGQYEQAARAVETDLSSIDGKSGTLLPIEAKRADVLMHLDAAEFWRLGENPSRAIAQFDAVEVLFRQEDESGFAETAAEQIGSVLINDNVASYVPTPPERVLANYYKGMAYWAKGDKNNAHREFNRADVRAKQALERYEDEVAKAKAEAAKDKNKKLNQSSGLQDEIYKNYPNVDEWVTYDNFVNPTVVYSNALLYGAGNGSDIEQANDLLERVYGMTGQEHSVIESDMTELEKSNGLGKKGGVWVIYEAGMSPSLKENRFDIPLPLNDRVILLAFAFPEIVSNRGAFNGHTLKLNGQELETTELTTMEKLMQTEFKKRWPAVQARAIGSAVGKALLQNAAAEESPLLNLVATVATAATTKADTRMWSMMPNSWSIAKHGLSGTSNLTVPYGGGKSISVPLKSGKSQLVYIKQPTAFAKPLVQVLEM